ncbi:MAG: class I tRNA ligase family protein, partial [Candidatus Dormibacteraeota bacterium]|nr:class I tRNA ligase family protein [Candidatus Dormibacteraeota bacterium]
CLVGGLVVDRQGKKMSKSRGNVIDPATAFSEFGADAARWFFYATGALAGELRVSREGFQDVVRLYMLTLWNVYSFFVTYAEIDGFDPAAEAPPVLERPVLDRWCLARLAETIDTVRAAMDRYEAQPATRAVEEFVEDLSKWYVRRSRRRFWKGEPGQAADKRAAYATLHTTLLTLARLLAPLMPFLAERMYRNLAGFEGDAAPLDGAPDSVHLTDYPTVLGDWRNPDVLIAMHHLRELVEDGLAARKEAGVRVRQPLAGATLASAPLDAELQAIFADELNIKSVTYEPPGDGTAWVRLDTEITPELRLEWLARELSRAVNDLRKKAGLRVEDRIALLIDADGDVRRAVDANRDYLAGETLATAIEFRRGDALAEWEGELGGEACWLGVTR